MFQALSTVFLWGFIEYYTTTSHESPLFRYQTRNYIDGLELLR